MLFAKHEWMKSPPHASGFDKTLALLHDPYRFISRTAKELGSTCFQTRIFGQKTVCFFGADAAKYFYDGQYTIRNGAIPEPLKATLVGKGSIQNLDGNAHLIRKKVFMSFMTKENVDMLVHRYQAELKQAAERWASSQTTIVLWDELKPILAAAVCDWTGVPLKSDEINQRTADLVSMFDSAASLSFLHIRSRIARKRTESWIEKLVLEHRTGIRLAVSGSVLETFSNFRDETGSLLASRLAAIEIINILRPTVAIAVYIVFVAHALCEYPEYKGKIIKDPGFLNFFVQEVRRFYPFFPAVVAKTRTEFDFDGVRIPKGIKLMLDLYGTNHDERLWSDPLEFNPDRYRVKPISPTNLVPQGGGSHHTNHRCPGEDPTLAIMKVSTLFFISEIEYDVPEQNRLVDFRRLPALPKSKFIISNVRLKKGH